MKCDTQLNFCIMCENFVIHPIVILVQAYHQKKKLRLQKSNLNVPAT